MTDRPDLEPNKHLIKVIGVGGGGNNAVNYMFVQGVKGVDFLVCNTDLQALSSSPITDKLQIGIELTKGLGAGANPEIGKKAALESEQEIREVLKDTKMLFITAGMGGGTGTGAAPVIASVAKELNILTVGIVTLPFSFEGKPKQVRAEKGIAELTQHCDTVIKVLNNRITELYGKSSLKEAFSKADMVLSQAASTISDIINEIGLVNVDFEDVKTVIQKAGSAVMGTGIASGDNKSKEAVKQALNSPLLNNTNIEGSRYILLSIKTKDENTIQIEEIDELTEYLQQQSGEDTEIIWGLTFDGNLDDNIVVTIIATGFDEQRNQTNKKKSDVTKEGTKKNKEDDNITFQIEQDGLEHEIVSTPQTDYQVEKKEENILLDSQHNWENIEQVRVTDNEEIKKKQDIPAYKRKGIQLYDANKLPGENQ